jgi:hypothetical protein
MSTPVIFTITSDGLSAAVAANAGGTQLRLTNLIALDSGGTQWGDFALSGGIVNVATNTARFSAILTSSTVKQAYTLNLVTSTGVIFATATSTTDPLVVVSANIDFAASFGLTLTGIPTGSITITIDPDASIALAIMAQHVGAANPHPEYLLNTRALANGIDADLSITNFIPAGTDLNTIKAVGEYAFNDPSIPYPNSPFVSNTGLMKVWREDNLVIVQQVTGTLGAGFAIRYYFDRHGENVWSGWRYYCSASTENIALGGLEQEITNRNSAISSAISSETSRAEGIETALINQMASLWNTYVTGGGFFDVNAGGDLTYAIQAALTHGSSSGYVGTDGSGTYSWFTIPTPAITFIVNIHYFSAFTTWNFAKPYPNSHLATVANYGSSPASSDNIGVKSPTTSSVQIFSSGGGGADYYAISIGY